MTAESFSSPTETWLPSVKTPGALIHRAQGTVSPSCLSKLLFYHLHSPFSSFKFYHLILQYLFPLFIHSLIHPFILLKFKEFSRPAVNQMPILGPPVLKMNNTFWLSMPGFLTALRPSILRQVLNLSFIDSLLPCKPFLFLKPLLEPKLLCPINDFTS